MVYKLCTFVTGCDAIVENHVAHVFAVAWQRPASMSGLAAKAQ